MSKLRDILLQMPDFGLEIVMRDTRFLSHIYPTAFTPVSQFVNQIKTIPLPTLAVSPLSCGPRLIWRYITNTQTNEL